MARSRVAKAGGSRKARYVKYAIPLVALLAITVVLAVSVLPASQTPAAVDYTFQLLIQVTNKNSSNPQVRNIAPGNSIGEPGGYWATSQYNSYQPDSTHYPIYMDSPRISCNQGCLIHVKSRVAYNYTLGDFFNVWGQPVGQNDTISIKSSGSFAWQLCTVSSGTPTARTEWGGLLLAPDLKISLIFYDTAGGLGCAPS